MKRVLVFFMLFAALVPLYADQEVYRATSFEVVMYKSLKRISGDGGVEPTYPISGSQLLLLLKNLDTSRFNEKELFLYENLVCEIDRDKDVPYEYEVGLSAGLYTRSAGYPIDSDALFFNPRERFPSIFLDGKIFWDDYAAIRFNLIGYDNTESNAISPKAVFSNFTNKESGRGPFQATLSLGYGKLAFEIGRDRLSAGNGRYNLFMGDNFAFEDHAKLSLIDPRFSYDFTYINFEDEIAPGVNDNPNFDRRSVSVVNHRFSIPLFNIFTLSLYETMLEYSANPFDVRYLDPVMILHNNESWDGGNNNNAFGVELSVNPGGGFELNAQIFVDQVQGDDEIARSEPGKIPPDSGALLINLTYSSAVYGGTLDVWAEGVLSSPVCYIKEYYPKDVEEFRWYQVDWLLGVRDSAKSFEYLGYKYGPNALGVCAGADFRNSELSLSALFDYHYCGAYKKHDYMNLSWDKFYNRLPVIYDEGQVFEHDFRIGVSAVYDVCPGVTLNGAAGWVGSFNHDYIAGNNLSDFQLSFGIKVDVARVLDSYFNLRIL